MRATLRAADVELAGLHRDEVIHAVRRLSADVDAGLALLDAEECTQPDEVLVPNMLQG